MCIFKISLFVKYLIFSSFDVTTLFSQMDKNQALFSFSVNYLQISLFHWSL